MAEKRRVTMPTFQEAAEAFRNTNVKGGWSPKTAKKFDSVMGRRGRRDSRDSLCRLRAGVDLRWTWHCLPVMDADVRGRRGASRKGKEADMTPAEWIAIGQLTVSAFAVGSIWFGIWQMRRAGDQREKREDARHAESMRALEALIKGMETVIERTAR